MKQKNRFKYDMLDMDLPESGDDIIWRAPLYAKTGSTIEVYPESVQSTVDMDISRAVSLTFHDSYQGITNTVLGKITGL